MPYVPPMSQLRTQYQARRRTIHIPLDGEDSQQSLYLRRLADAIQASSMVRSLYVQIGVWNFQSLTTASATGTNRQSVASLTFQLPHGDWLVIHRFRKGLSKLPSHCTTEKKPLPELTKRMNQRSRQSWWRYLTQR